MIWARPLSSRPTNSRLGAIQTCKREPSALSTQSSPVCQGCRVYPLPTHKLIAYLPTGRRLSGPASSCSVSQLSSGGGPRAHEPIPPSPVRRWHPQVELRPIGDFRSARVNVGLSNCEPRSRGAISLGRSPGPPMPSEAENKQRAGRSSASIIMIVALAIPLLDIHRRVKWASQREACEGAFQRESSRRFRTASVERRSGPVARPSGEIWEMGGGGEAGGGVSNRAGAEVAAQSDRRARTRRLHLFVCSFARSHP